MTDEQLKLAKVFFPHVLRETARVREKGIKFVHYTSADTGLKILRSERMLLRNSTLMNDFSKIRHGLDCLLHAYNGDVGDRLKQALYQIQSDLPKVLEENFNAQLFDVMSETYLLSVSEHGDIDGYDHEDKLGRLSMWRACAANNGVAFILNNSPFLGESSALGAYTVPVSYSLPDEYQPVFEEVVHAIEQNIDILNPLADRLYITC